MHLNQVAQINVIGDDEKYEERMLKGLRAKQ